MSDILSEIDDTLADWHGSADSMHWRPDSGENELAATQTLVGVGEFMATVRDVFFQTTSTTPDPLTLSSDDLDELHQGWTFGPIRLEMSFPLAEPEPGMGYWEYAALRRTIAGMFAIAPRALGLPPRYGFDARYRQRQKNRRKRRR